MAIARSGGRFFVPGKDGAPANGWKVETHAPGSAGVLGTNDKAVYTDYTLTTPLPNPFVLDERGEKEVWFKGQYLIKVRDELNNLIYTFDYYGTGDSSLDYDSVAKLKLTAGEYNGQIAYLKGYYAVGDGGGGEVYWDATSTETPDNGMIFQVTGVTTGRWKRPDKGFIDVQWYGIQASVDNQAKIQAALDYAATNVLSLYFSAGTYTIASGMTTSANILIFGAGVRETIIDCSLGFGYWAFTFSDPAPSVLRGASIRDMTIDGVSKSVTRRGVYFDSNQVSGKVDNVNFTDLYAGIEVHSDAVNGRSYGHEISNCVFSGILTKAIYAYANSEQLLIDHCWFQSGNNLAGNAAIHIVSSTSTQIKGCIIQVFYDGIVIEGGKPVKIEDCHFEDNNNYNISLDSSTSYWNDDIEISGCYMRAGKRGVYITADAGREGQGLTLLNNTFTTITDTGIAGGTTQSPIFGTASNVMTNIVAINNNWHKDFTTSVAIFDGVTPDLEITSEQTDILMGKGLKLTGKGLFSAGIGVGNSATATTPGSVTDKIEVFDETGASLGFLAVYGSIT